MKAYRVNNRRTTSINTKNTQKKAPVPEKGRIRSIIIAVLIAVAIKFLLPSGDKTPDTAEATPTDSTAIDSGAVKDTVVKEAKVLAPTPKKPVKPLNLEKFLPGGDIDSLLAQFPVVSTIALDTITFKGRELIRYYSTDTALLNSGNLYMQRYHPRFGAAVIMQPRTGRVLALSSYINPENPETVPHFAGPLYSKTVPAASVAKTLTAAAAVEVCGLTTRSEIEYTGRNNTLFRNQLTPDVENGRTLSLRESYAKSVNPVFGRLGVLKLGANNLFKYAQKFGFNSTIPFEIPTDNSHFAFPEDATTIAEVASGFNQNTTLSPLLGALIGGAISNRGKMIAPTIIDSIVDMETGLQIYKRKPSLWRVATTEKTAAEVMVMMEDVVKYGTAQSAFKNVKASPRFNGFRYGGKTGTVDMDGYGQADWFVGFMKDSTNANQDIACGVFLVNGPKWTVHSSYIAAEMMRKHLMRLQKEEQILLEQQEEELKKEMEK